MVDPAVAPSQPQKAPEIRYVQLDGVDHFVLDELVAFNAYVHLEQMSDSQFHLIVEANGVQVHIGIGAKRAHVSAWEIERG